MFAEEYKEYFIKLEIQNNNERDIKLLWVLENEEKSVIIKGKSVTTLEIKVTSRTYPQPVAFRAADTKSGSFVLLRQRKELFLIPRSERIKEVVTIGEVLS